MDGGIQKGGIRETGSMGNDSGQHELEQLQERRRDATLRDVKPENPLVQAQDVTKSNRAEQALRILTEETAATTGSEFFHSLARAAAQALGARFAFVSETLSEMESRSLAF